MYLVVVAFALTLFRYTSTHELVKAFKYSLSLSRLSLSLFLTFPTLTLIDLALREFDTYWCLSYFLFCHMTMVCFSRSCWFHQGRVRV